MGNLAFSIEFEHMWNCATCSLPVLVPRGMVRRVREDGERAFCVNGHANIAKETEVKRLTRELDAAQKAAASARAARLLAENAANELRAKLDRVGKGVCPCCKRSFTNLRRHMANKHPEAAKRQHGDVG